MLLWAALELSSFQTLTPPVYSEEALKSNLHIGSNMAIMDIDGDGTRNDLLVATGLTGTWLFGNEPRDLSPLPSVDQVYVFMDVTTTGTLTPSQVLEPDSMQVNHPYMLGMYGFGASIREGIINGTHVIVITSPFEESDRGTHGAIYIYVWDPVSSSLKCTQKIIPYGLDPTDMTISYVMDAILWDQNADGEADYLVFTAPGYAFSSMFTWNLTAQPLDLDPSSRTVSYVDVSSSSYVLSKRTFDRMYFILGQANFILDTSGNDLVVGVVATNTTEAAIEVWDNSIDAYTVATSVDGPGGYYLVDLSGSFPAGVLPYRMAFGALDAEPFTGSASYEDLVVTSFGGGADFIPGYDWKANGVPEPKPLSLASKANGGIYLADLNADGADDLLIGVATSPSGTVSIFTGSLNAGFDVNNADGSVRPPSSSYSMMWGTSIVVANLTDAAYDDVFIGDPNYFRATVSQTQMAPLSSPVETGAISVKENVKTTGTNDASETLTPDSLAIYPSKNLGGFGTGGLNEKTICVGDFNGDGYNDLVVAEPWYGAFRGRVVIYWGTASGFDYTSPHIIDSAYTASTTIMGFGFTVLGADPNGDGKKDLLISALGGVLFVFSNKPASEFPAHASDADAKIIGVGRVLDAGDIDGDGFEDVLATSDGDANLTVLWGASYTPLQETTKIQIEDTVGSSWNDGFLLDFDGNGTPDIVASDPGGSATASRAGSVYIIPNSVIVANKGSFLGSVLSADLSIYYIRGTSQDERLGAVLTVGDFNGDGRADIVLGNETYDFARGRLLFIYGRDFPATNTEISSHDLTLDGSSYGSRLGSFLATVYDLDPTNSEKEIYLLTGEKTPSDRAGIWKMYTLKGTSLKEVSFSWLQGSYGSGDYARWNYPFAISADTTNDGWTDLIISDGYHEDATGGEDIYVGAVHVIHRENNSLTLSWAGEPDFTDDGVEYVGGSEGTFIFKVKYSDSDNEAPDAVQVKIDLNDDGSFSSDEVFDMVKEDPKDNNYMDGVVYSVKIENLRPAGDSAFNYQFYASNSHEPSGKVFPESSPQVKVVHITPDTVQEGGKLAGVILTNNKVREGAPVGLYIDAGAVSKEVDIKVYDISGSLVKEVFSGTLTGYRKFDIDTLGLRAGVYLIYIKVGDEKEIRKMAVVK